MAWKLTQKTDTATGQHKAVYTANTEKDLDEIKRLLRATEPAGSSNTYSVTASTIDKRRR